MTVTEIAEYLDKVGFIVRQLYKNDANHSLFKVFYLSEISGSLNNLGHVKGLEENKAFSKPVVFKF